MDPGAVVFPVPGSPLGVQGAGPGGAIADFSPIRRPVASPTSIAER